MGAHMTADDHDQIWTSSKPANPTHHTESDLHYVRRRYLTTANLRRAITSIVNATHAARHEHLWGEVTTTASDSTKFGAWDQNLLTEWHARYKGPGVMIYWHVDRKALCVYSQLKSCSSSEIAAMIDCLEQPGRPHLLEAQSARDTLEILLAIYESSRVRQAVRLPLDVTDNPLLTMLADGVV